jgi:hypothetical protein
LNCGAGVKTFAFHLLTRNQVVFSESGHLPMAKFAGLRHRLEISGWWGIVTRNLIPAVTLLVRHYKPVRFTCITRHPKNGSPKQVRMHCSDESSTQWLQCDCPTFWKTTTFFAPAVRFFDVKYS